MNALNENLVIVIPARKNSKRLKIKTLRIFLGFLYLSGVCCGFISKATAQWLREISVVCTSDDDRILDLVKKNIPLVF